MAIFLLKKCFFDFLDHFVPLLILNSGLLLSLVSGFGISVLINLLIPQIGYYSVFIAFVAMLFTSTVYIGAAAGMTNDIVDQKRGGWKEFFGHLKVSLKNSVLLSSANTLLLFLLINAFSFYTGTELIFGPFAFAFLLWIALLWLAASQFFFTLHYRLEKRFFKILKKMFLFFFDNQLFSIGVFLVCFIVGILSIPGLLLIPGFITLQLFINTAVKLRLYKYAYLESQAGGKDPARLRKIRIPWNILLDDEKNELENRKVHKAHVRAAARSVFPGHKDNGK